MALANKEQVACSPFCQVSQCINHDGILGTKLVRFHFCQNIIQIIPCFNIRIQSITRVPLNGNQSNMNSFFIAGLRVFLYFHHNYNYVGTLTGRGINIDFANAPGNNNPHIGLIIICGTQCNFQLLPEPLLVTWDNQRNCFS